MSHGTRVNAAVHTYGGGLASQLARSQSMRRLVPTCDMTHHYLGHSSLIFVIGLVQVCDMANAYGVALVSRIDKSIGLFCKRALQKRRYSAKETDDFIDPNDRSHPTRVTRHD